MLQLRPDVRPKLGSSTAKSAWVHRIGPASSLLVVAVIALGLTSACGGGATQSGEQASGGFADLADDYLDLARERGASETQIALLETARDRGEVSLELAREAAQATVQCMREGGVDAEYSEYTSADGWVVPGYTYPASADMTEAATDSIADACDKQEFEWVYKLHETQPSAVATSNVFLLSRENELRECLEDHGYVTDGSADGIALADQALQVLDDTGMQVNCLAGSGIDLVR